MSGTKKTKPEADAALDEALKETFPGSDALAANVTDEEPVRPVERQTPKIDKELVDRLARKAKQSDPKAAPR